MVMGCAASAILCSVSAYTPAALTMQRVSSGAVVGLDGPPGSAVQRVQARNFGVKPKLHTVFGGVLRQRKRQAERADDAARGRPQCGDGASEMFGSISTSSSRSMMRSPSTPLAMPFS